MAGTVVREFELETFAQMVLLTFKVRGFHETMEDLNWKSVAYSMSAMAPIVVQNNDAQQGNSLGMQCCRPLNRQWVSTISTWDNDIWHNTKCKSWIKISPTIFSITTKNARARERERSWTEGTRKRDEEQVGERNIQLCMINWER